MTDAEFDVLDELYFLQSYKSLIQALKMNDSELTATLESLLGGGSRLRKSPAS
jgi:hypothetical protein